MTYREAYMKCETLDELLKVVEDDLAIGLVVNPDRIPIIKKEAEYVANLKFRNEVK